jgi:hypothetical protein
MSLVLNSQKIIYSPMIVSKLSKVYKNIGANEYYLEKVKASLEKIKEYNIKLDAYYLFKLLNIELSDNRQRLIILKNSSPRLKAENILSNIKYIISTFSKKEQTETLDSQSILNITNHIFNDNTRFSVTLNKFTNIIIDKKASYDEMLKQYNLTKNTIDSLTIAICLFVDFHNLSPLTDNTETIELLVLYQLLLLVGVKSLYFSSFFFQIHKKKEEFYLHLKETERNWNEGLSNIIPILNFLLDIINNMYDETEKAVNNLIEKSQLFKAESIETTILSFKTKFNKEDVRKFHPFVSDSTINRSLKKLKTENRIKPLNNGRSAYWMRVKV